MGRELIVHFEPRGGGNAVAAEVFVAALGAIVEGFRSISDALAPAIARRRSWSRAEVKDALTLGFCAVRQGSLDMAVAPGFGARGPHLDNHWIADVGWSAAAMAIDGAARGKIVVADVPLAAAQNFARAARVARDANVNVSLCSRRVKNGLLSQWRTNVDLTGIDPALTKYVERLSVAEPTVTQARG